MGVPKNENRNKCVSVLCLCCTQDGHRPLAPHPRKYEAGSTVVIKQQGNTWYPVRHGHFPAETSVPQGASWFGDSWWLCSSSGRPEMLMFARTKRRKS